MNLSHKLTFSLASIFLLLAFAVVPAMAQVTIEAEWKADLDDDPATNTAGQGQAAGWSVTIGGLSDNAGEDNDVVTVTYLDPALAAAAAAGNQSGFAAVVDAATTSTGTIDAGIGAVISVQVQVVSGATGGAVTKLYQRVTFPAAGPTAQAVPSTELKLLPKLKKLTTSNYYVTFGNEVTVTFDFADAVANANDDPVALLHISDVFDPTDAFDQTGWQITGVSGNNQVMLRPTLARTAGSATITVGLNPVYAQVAGDGVAPNPAASVAHAMITYDNTAPTVTNNAITVAAPPGSPSPPDSVWGGDFPVFNLTFSVDDDSDGSGLPDTNPVRIDTDTDKLEVVVIGLGIDDTNIAGTEYLVQIRPIVGRSTTAGEEVVITVMPVDKAGNEGSASISVKLAASTPPDALYQSAAPASGNVMRNGTITVTFDKDPGAVTATAGVAVSGTGNTRTLTVDAAQAAGALSVTLTWGQSGRQVLAYTVVLPPDPAIAYSSADPASGNIDQGGTIELTFAADPGTVTSDVGTITGTGATRTLTIPAAQAAGEGDNHSFMDHGWSRRWLPDAYLHSNCTLRFTKSDCPCKHFYADYDTSELLCCCR